VKRISKRYASLGASFALSGSDEPQCSGKGSYGSIPFQATSWVGRFAGSLRKRTGFFNEINILFESVRYWQGPPFGHSPHNRQRSPHQVKRPAAPTTATERAELKQPLQP
jgi:hypothetical protein